MGICGMSEGCEDLGENERECWGERECEEF